MQRSCEVCGKGFEARLSTARYCSSTCRARKSRSKTGGAPLRVVPPSPVASSGVVEATQAALDAAGRAGSPHGQAALLLAARMDAGAESSSGLAALAREHRAALVAALDGEAKGVGKLALLRAARQRDAAAGDA